MEDRCGPLEGVVTAMVSGAGRGLAGRRVFVTGHTGFKGSWLVQMLRRRGARVTGYSLPPATEPSLFDAAGIAALLERHVEADVRDAARLEAEVAAAAADVVIHLAAQPIVRRSHRDPVDTVSTNVTGTATLLDAVRRAGRPCAVIVVTSDKCYLPHDDGRPHVEDDALGGRDPYSASKAAAEIVTAAFRSSYFPPERLGDHGVQVATVRAGNVIGGGDWAEDRIITDLVRHLAEGRRVPVRNPAAIRPWQHVLDPLEGYVALAGLMLSEPSGRWCRGWNFGPDPTVDITVEELVAIFIDAWGSGSSDDVHDPRAPIETATLRLAIDRATSDLGGRPRFSPAVAIRRAAEWYRAFDRDPAAARALCDADLDAHESAPGDLPR